MQKQKQQTKDIHLQPLKMTDRLLLLDLPNTTTRCKRACLPSTWACSIRHPWSPCLLIIGKACPDHFRSPRSCAILTIFPYMKKRHVDLRQSSSSSSFFPSDSNTYELISVLVCLTCSCKRLRGRVSEELCPPPTAPDGDEDKASEDRVEAEKPAAMPATNNPSPNYLLD